MPSAKTPGINDQITKNVNIKAATPIKDKDGEASNPSVSSAAAAAAAREILSSKLQTMTSDLMSSLSVNTATLKMMEKKQVDDVIRGLEQWNAKWFEELVNKVKDELTQSADDVRSLSSASASTPLSGSCSSSNSPKFKPYQASVEDDYSPQDEFELGRGPIQVTVLELSPSSPSTPASSTTTTTQANSPSYTYSYGNTPLQSRSPSPQATTRMTIAVKPPPQARPSVRFSDGQPPLAPIITHDTCCRQDRSRSQNQYNVSAVDMKWDTLFNDKNEPTLALGRFLRGIANYIISEYSPADSLVITPDKLFKFYTKYKLDREVFPFQRVFDTQHRKTHRALEFLYLDLRCEYHVVPATPGSRPCVPALTPAGFQDWMMLFIRACPDQEARRLDLIAADLPIVADGPRGNRTERFPRQISRHFFPDRSHTKAYDLLASSFNEWRSIATSPEPALRPIYITSASSSASSSPARRRERDYKDTSSQTTDGKPKYKIRYERAPSSGSNSSGTSSSRSSRHTRERDGEAHRQDGHFRSRESSPLVREKSQTQPSRRYQESSSCGRLK